MEGAAYLAQLQDDPELEAQFDQIVESLLLLKNRMVIFILRTQPKWEVTKT